LCYKILLGKAKVGTVYISQGRGQERLCFFFSFFFQFLQPLYPFLFVISENPHRPFLPYEQLVYLTFLYAINTSTATPCQNQPTLTARAPQLRGYILLRVQVIYFLEKPQARCFCECF